MVVEFITICFMLATIVVKWAATTALQQKQTELAGAIEENARARQRLKIAVGAVNIANREIDQQKRKIKSSEHRIVQMTAELQALQQEIEQAAELNQEKLRLAQELKKRKGLA